MKSELNYNNDISLYKLCERCKRAQATLNCSQCSPLQNFCNKCDIVVHSLPSKISHIRNSLNTLNVKDPFDENINKLKFDNSTNFISNPNLISNNDYLKIHSFYPQYNQPMTNLNNILDNNNNKIGEDKEVYTKDYINELTNNHLKEKNELLLKINSLENTLNRLRNCFGQHINKMQNNLIDNNKESNKKLKLIEEENEIKLMKILGDKNLEIGQLKNDLENLNKINNNLLISLKRLEEEKNTIEINLNNKINELNTQLSFLKSELDKNQIHSNLLIEQMKNDYNKNISSLLREKDNKIKNIYINQKIEFDNLNNEIKSLKRDNLRLNGQIEQNEKNCENSFNELQKENFCLYNENKFMQDQNNEIFNKYKNIEEYLMNIQNENEVFKKNIEEQNEEINKKGNEILYLNNKMNSLKNSNNVLEETNQKLKQYNGQLQCINENMSVEFSNKLKNLNYIENQNCILTRENEKLKNQIREYDSYSFNKIC